MGQPRRWTGRFCELQNLAHSSDRYGQVRSASAEQTSAVEQAEELRKDASS